jgi:hypothetical protein
MSFWSGKNDFVSYIAGMRGVCHLPSLTRDMRQVKIGLFLALKITREALYIGFFCLTSRLMLNIQTQGETGGGAKT